MESLSDFYEKNKDTTLILKVKRYFTEKSITPFAPTNFINAMHSNLCNLIIYMSSCNLEKFLNQKRNSNLLLLITDVRHNIKCSKSTSYYWTTWFNLQNVKMNVKDNKLSFYVKNQRVAAERIARHAGISKDELMFKMSCLYRETNIRDFQVLWINSPYTF
jgi:hypothetical protein